MPRAAEDEEKAEEDGVTDDCEVIAAAGQTEDITEVAWDVVVVAAPDSSSESSVFMNTVLAFLAGGSPSS